MYIILKRLLMKRERENLSSRSKKKELYLRFKIYFWISNTPDFETRRKQHEKETEQHIT